MLKIIRKIRGLYLFNNLILSPRLMASISRIWIFFLHLSVPLALVHIVYICSSSSSQLLFVYFARWSETRGLFSATMNYPNWHWWTIRWTIAHCVVQFSRKICTTFLLLLLTFKTICEENKYMYYILFLFENDYPTNCCCIFIFAQIHLKIAHSIFVVHSILCTYYIAGTLCARTLPGFWGHANKSDQT